MIMIVTDKLGEFENLADICIGKQMYGHEQYCDRVFHDTGVTITVPFSLNETNLNRKTGRNKAVQQLKRAPLKLPFL